jgi:tripartite-type tricarboxylate transporter receptor subunit TctC
MLPPLGEPRNSGAEGKTAANSAGGIPSAREVPMKSMTIRRRLLAGSAAAAAAAAVFAAPPAWAQEFYEGKTIEVIVPFAEGGVTDVVARFLQSFLQQHIPGNPEVTIRNLGGGGSILGANYFEENAQPDGEMILFTTSSTVFPYLLDQEGVEYDLADKRVGYAIAIGPVVYASPETGVETPADLANPDVPLVYGGIGATASDMPVILAFEALGLDVQTALGFQGRGPIRLAFERGETNLDFQFTAVYLTQVLPLVEAGQAVPLMTGGSSGPDGRFTERDPVVSDLPSVFEVYQEIHGEEPSGPSWQAYETAAALTFQYGLTAWMPEETPQEALEALAQAVEAINADPEFQQRGQEVTGGYELQSGLEIEDRVKGALSLEPDVEDYLRTLLTEKYGVDL